MQHVLVALIVLLAVAAVARRYAPPAWRSAFKGFAAKGARKLDWHALAERLEAPPPAVSDCGTGGCSACSGCDLSPKTASSGEFTIVIQRPGRS